MADSNKPISVLISEDHIIVRDGLNVLLSSEPDIKVVAEADNGQDAIKKTRALKPDVVILDVAMPIVNGIEAARIIHAAHPRTKIIMLSMYSDDEYIMEALRAGASGYLIKHSAAAALIEAVREVHAGRAYFSPTVSKTVLSAARDRSTTFQPDLLTTREREILLLIADGKSNKKVAMELSLSTNTVRKHRQNIMRKLNIHDVVSLTRYAVKQGYTANK